MSRRFIAAILAASLSITGLAANSARAADAEDIAKILGTVATLYIIGNAIQNQRGDDRKVYVYGDRGRYDKDRHDKGRYDHGHYGKDRHDRDRYDYGRYDRGHGARALPAACVMRGWNQKGQARQVLGVRCVEQRYDRAHRLPNHCRAQMRTERGVRVVYKKACLERQGYDIARR